MYSEFKSIHSFTNCSAVKGEVWPAPTRLVVYESCPWSRRKCAAHSHAVGGVWLASVKSSDVGSMSAVGCPDEK